ncbi:hypothetical protein ACLOJK_006925, partial [Asimina triloba]
MGVTAGSWSVPMKKAADGCCRSSKGRAAAWISPSSTLALRLAAADRIDCLIWRLGRCRTDRIGGLP